MNFARSLIAGALAPASVLAMAAPATAQADPSGGADGILVEAPRTVVLPLERSPYSGAPLVVVTLKISVLYGDLDLTNPAQASRLMTRIDRVARDACADLDRLYPLSPDAMCVDHAKSGAMSAANAAIAAAR